VTFRFIKPHAFAYAWATGGVASGSNDELTDEGSAER
jgi:hypothetical protein